RWLHRFRYRKAFQAHAKVQLIPMLFMPDGSVLQDSTPILDMLEERYPEPAIHPADPALRFLSILLEEYGDEWGNKLMFHYRWGYPADQRHRGRSLAAATVGGVTFDWLGRLAAPLVAPLIVRRMIPRMAFAGANDNNKPLLVESFANVADILEAHLSSRSYLFGERPAFGDFGLWGQLYQAYDDPSGRAIFTQRAPAVVAWLERMQAPEARGEFESLDTLEKTLAPLFSREVGPRFLAWSAANARAWDAQEKETRLTMDGRVYYQKTFKYPAGSLALLRQRFDAVRDNATLNEFLAANGCLEYLGKD
ncbi:MAG: glutathione S-transferase family protein, partial [Halioglobus sp.]|nr:glutathione S-transferase family protein [Halioglobus sp.]